MLSLQHLPSCSFAIALSSLLLIKAGTAIPLESLETRKEVDANIWCRRPLPNPDPWPANTPPRSTYTSLFDLCARSRDRPNVGCLCDYPYEHVECLPELGDPGLRAHFLQDCMNDCFCQITRNHLVDAASSESRGPWVPARVREGGPNPFADPVHVPMPVSAFAAAGQGGQTSGGQRARPAGQPPPRPSPPPPPAS